MWIILVWVALGSAAPWVLVSHITRQVCAGTSCRPFGTQEGPEERVVQTFATAEECLKVRAQLTQQVEAAVAPVQRRVQERTPALFMRVSPTFLCTPTTGTTEEQVR
jgi:hypothetical protein